MNNATELVKLIRKEYGNYFCIAIGGFPEGHPSNNLNNTHQSTTKTLDEIIESDLVYLKQKVDAGADLILTNFFYDSKLFIYYLEKCRKYGISCPIIPGYINSLV